MIELTSSATKDDKSLLSRAVRHTVIRSPGIANLILCIEYQISLRIVELFSYKEKALYDCRLYFAVDSA